MSGRPSWERMLQTVHALFAVDDLDEFGSRRLGGARGLGGLRAGLVQRGRHGHRPGNLRGPAGHRRHAAPRSAGLAASGLPEPDHRVPATHGGWIGQADLRFHQPRRAARARALPTGVSIARVEFSQVARIWARSSHATHRRVPSSAYARLSRSDSPHPGRREGGCLERHVRFVPPKRGHAPSGCRSGMVDERTAFREGGPTRLRQPLVSNAEGCQLTARLVPASTSSASDAIVIDERIETYEPSRLEDFGLTRREAEVLWWVSRGKTNEEIADAIADPHRYGAQAPRARVPTARRLQPGRGGSESGRRPGSAGAATRRWTKPGSRPGRGRGGPPVN